jgi:hypothetical protein
MSRIEKLFERLDYTDLLDEFVNENSRIAEDVKRLMTIDDYLDVQS